MLPVYEDPWFTFRFAADRIIPRFHLEGVEVGRRVEIYKIDPGTGERLGLLATATAGEGGWVDLTEPIIVRAGEGFIAVPDLETGLVSRQSSIDGYSFRSFRRAAASVNVQWMHAWQAFRLCSQEATSAASLIWLSSRRSRHCPFMMRISVSAMFNQLPCLGV